MLQNTDALKDKIKKFKLKILSKERPFEIKPTQFDIFLVNITRSIFFIFFQLTKKIIIQISYMFKDLKNYSKTLLSNFDKLEEKIKTQDKIIENSLKLNAGLFKQVEDMNLKINSLLENKNLFENEQKRKELNETPKSKEEFYQNENLRLSTQLHEMNKKYEILKEEINKFENQRSNMIKKINSLNDEIEDSNILTNVFENSYKKEKVQVIDHKNVANKNNLDLDSEVSKIFSSKN